MNKDISRRIVILGFAMTCLIVMYHEGQIDSSQAAGSFDGQLNNAIGFVMDKLAVLAMSWFFTVTGFLLFRNLTMKNYARKMKRRISSLLVPYLLWQAITVVKIMLLNGFTTELLSDWVARTFLMCGFPPNGALW